MSTRGAKFDASTTPTLFGHDNPGSIKQLVCSRLSVNRVAVTPGHVYIIARLDAQT